VIFWMTWAVIYHNVYRCKFSIHFHFCTQNYWVFGPFSSSGVLRNRNMTFRKLNLFPSSGEGGRRHLLSVGPEKERISITGLALSKGPNWVGVFSPLHMRMETNPVSETSCFYSLEYQTMEKTKNPVILCTIHHRQNPLESTSISNCPCLLISFKSKYDILLSVSSFIGNCLSFCCALKCLNMVWGVIFVWLHIMKISSAYIL
jgi:hypothetical protein